MLSPSSVWLVLVLLVLILQPDLLEPRWDFNSCRRTLSSVYCVVVVATSCYRTALPLVAAYDLLFISPLKELMNLSAGMAPGGGPWARLLDAAGCMVSPLCEIPWILALALADPKESAEGLEFRMTRSRASCASWKWDFHFSQVRSSQGNPSNLGHSSGNFFSARSEWDATATSHASDMARPAHLAFLWASSQQVTNSGILEYSTHQDSIHCWSPMP